MDTIWVHPMMGSATCDGRMPLSYMIALQHVVVALDREPAWRAWWKGSGAARCELGIVAQSRPEHTHPSADIRKEGDQVRANFTCAPPAAAGRDPADLFPLAVAEVTGMFQVIREAIGLPPLPTMPPLPELPPDVDVEVTARPLPPPPPPGGTEQPGYLTLTEIQEFFGRD